MRTVFALAVLLAASSLPCEAQRYELGDAADLDILLMDDVQPGAAAYRTEGEAVLTAEDVAAVTVELSEGRSDPQERYNLRLTLTPLGSYRLSQATRLHPGRSLVLRAHGRTFNAMRMDGMFSGRELVWRALLPQEVADAWAQHIMGRDALPKLDGAP